MRDERGTSNETTRRGAAVAHRTHNPGVVGAIPTAATKFPGRFRRVSLASRNWRPPVLKKRHESYSFVDEEFDEGRFG